jgi:hypothetical protein
MSVSNDRPRVTVTLQDLETAGVTLPYDSRDATGRRVVSLDIGTDDARVQLLDEVEILCALVDRARQLLDELPPVRATRAVQSSRGSAA